MTARNAKDWTILIYANGNNDMEPEVYQSMLEAEKVGSSDNVNVVMQLSRLNQGLVRALRPMNPLSYTNESWNGVRRYYIGHKHSILVENKGIMNMAHPASLSDFIQWGMKSYPAKHYMLLISGHGIGFVGGLLDLSVDLPYLMGLAEMAQAINNSKELTGNSIDLLILDMCYMNLLENIYEFGWQEINAVKRIVTYIDNGPLSGLPLCNLIAATQEFAQLNDLNLFLKSLIPELPADLIAYDINPKKLRIIKDAVNQLAYDYLSSTQENLENPLECIRILDPDSSWFTYIEKINKELQNIIVYHSESLANNKTAINLVAENLGKLIALYCKFAFARENHWTSLLSNTSIDECSTMEFKAEPMALSRSGLTAILQQLNPALNSETLMLFFKRHKC